jgi:haloacetate dehalogenase
MEDYRAGLGIDREHDEADRAAGRDWADDVCGRSIDCGHHIAEEASAELAARLSEFFTPAGSGSSRAGT